MGWQSSASRRRFLLISGGGISAAVLTACTERAPTFVVEPTPAAAPAPVKMQRLLVWLPSDEKFVDWAFIATQLAASLAPYGVTMETGRYPRLEISRSDDQKALMENFKPTYRLEVDMGAATSSGVGSTTNTQINLVGALYQGASRTPVARFQHRARSRTAPELVPQVVEVLKKGGYL